MSDHVYKHIELTGSSTQSSDHAVAVAMSYGFERGLALMDELTSLDSYYLFHAARADLLRRLKRHAEARAAYEKALTLAASLVDQEYLRERIRLLNGAQVGGSSEWV